LSITDPLFINRWIGIQQALSLSRFSPWAAPPKLAPSYKVKDLAETTDASKVATKIMSCMMGRKNVEIVSNEE
jgi:hypothetical protein